MNMNAMDYLLL